MSGAHEKHVAIVGGGPAGLMASDVLVRGGARVTLHDQMPTAGRKFLLAGRGGLNLTHSEPCDKFVTRYSGTDATMGLAFAHTGVLYPFFGAMLGWLGVALTGSDTASNVLFGGLQKITSEQLGLNPNLMAAANSSGGVMGKMIDAQSIVVASTATNWFGHEGTILRFVFFHSIALACLVGVLVMLQAYYFTGMIVH